MLAPTGLEKHLSPWCRPDMNARTMDGVNNIEGFEDMRTPRHQLRYPPKITPASPQEFQLSEVEAI